MRKLSVEEAKVAALDLVEAVLSGRPWDASTAEECLPDGWYLGDVDVNDITWITLGSLERMYLSNAVRNTYDA